MERKAIFFDLDGTLTDSGEGITNCAALALEHFGLPVPDKKTLGVFVGPPLRETFLKFGVKPEQIEEAVRVFRGRYTTVGKFENIPYPGIPELLQTLKDHGHRLFVATSKPEVTALEIMEKFQLSPYFEKICGATLDGSRDSKSSVIAYLLNTCAGISQAVMVGDTAFDVLGAAEHRIPTIGVAWGYGNVTEMQEAGAVSIANTPQELLELLEK